LEELLSAEREKTRVLAARLEAMGRLEVGEPSTTLQVPAVSTSILYNK
jgi:hypothetical protein